MAVIKQKYSENTLTVASENAKKLRKAYGYTQTYIDRVIGTKTGTYWNFENGRSWMLLSNILKVCNLFNISFDELCNEKLTVTASINVDVKIGEQSPIIF